MAREIYVVGNWKMYKTAREATDYIEKARSKTGGMQNKYLFGGPVHFDCSGSFFC